MKLEILLQERESEDTEKASRQGRSTSLVHDIEMLVQHWRSRLKKYVLFWYHQGSILGCNVYDQ